MLRISWPHVTFMGVCLALLIVVIPIPVSAYNVTIFGPNAGFDPALHTDSVVVLQSIPGSSGSDLDTAVDTFTQRSVDVMVIGGNATFSQATVMKIESAVAAGKILVVTYPGNRLFAASLPATNGGTAPGGQFLEIANPDDAGSQEIFRNLPNRYAVKGTAPEREQAFAKSGAVFHLNYDTGLPALLSWKFGHGAVIEWTTTPVPSYMTSADADTITNRIVTRLLTEVTPIPTDNSQVTPQTTGPQVSPTGSFVPVTGDLIVYSSPLGASVLIDGVYSGITPLNLTGISPGNHILRLTESGYYDYEGTIYIVTGQTAHAFGTLPPLSQYSSAPTPVPTAAVPVIVMVTPTETEAPKGLLENSSVVVAIFGIITALIAGGVSIFTHVFKGNK